MAIFKVRDIQLNQSVLVQAVSQPLPVQGKFGPQQRWDVTWDGEGGTLYTNVYKEGPDRISQALSTYKPIVITRQLDPTGTKTILVPTLADEAAPNPSPFTPPSPRKPAQQFTPETPPVNDREKTITYLAIFKAVAEPTSTTLENHQRTVAALGAMNRWLKGEEIEPTISEVYPPEQEDDLPPF